MKKFFQIAAIVAVAGVFACGPKGKTAEQIETERQDSIRVADSITAVNAQRVADSLSAVEAQRIADSIAAAEVKPAAKKK